MEQNKQKHNCRTKIAPIWEVLVSTIDGAMYCKGCGERLDESQIHFSTMERIRRRR